MINQKEFGKRLRETRKSKKLTQENLSKLAQISIQSISKYENGEVLPTLEYLHDIAAILNVSIDYLIYGNKVNRELINTDRITDYKTFVNKTLNLIETDLVSLKLQEGPFLPKAVLLQIDDPTFFNIFKEIKKYVDDRDKLDTSTYNLIIDNILDNINKPIH